MRPSDYHIHHLRRVSDPAALEDQAQQRAERREHRWRRAGEVLANILLVLAMLCLGVVALIALGSTIWLMVDADDGNLTQSMSIYTVFGGKYWAILLTGFLSAAGIVALCRFVWKHGTVLDGVRGLRWLVGVTFAVQLGIILAMQTRDTFWGDSWMVNDFVTSALKQGSVASLFTGAYKTLFYDARLYFSCYPFQATFFWLLYGLRLVFGEFAYMAFQVLSALGVELGVVSLMALGCALGLDARAQRVLYVLVVACLPMYWLSTFLYGNALGCGFALAFLACQARAMGAGASPDAGASSDAGALSGTGASLGSGVPNGLTVSNLASTTQSDPASFNHSKSISFTSFISPNNRSALKWVALSLVPLALALCVKATFILFAIGALIAWVIVAVRRRNAWCLGATLAVVLCARMLSGLPFEALRVASGGYEFTGALTTLNHLELGLRMGRGEFYVSVDGSSPTYAPGGWSNYANAIWAQASGDAQLQNQWAASAIVEDLSDFAVAPDYAAWFFTTKLATEWADPTYQSLYYLSMCGLPGGGRVNPADTSSPLGVICAALIFLLDGYQSVLFGAALGFIVWSIHFWESTQVRAARAVTLLLAATFFTGFGCYLLWEAKSVYVLPFAIVLIPLAAAGLAELFGAVASRRRG